MAWRPEPAVPRPSAPWQAMQSVLKVAARRPDLLGLSPPCRPWTLGSAGGSAAPVTAAVRGLRRRAGAGVAATGWRRDGGPAAAAERDRARSRCSSGSGRRSCGAVAGGCGADGWAAGAGAGPWQPVPALAWVPAGIPPGRRRYDLLAVLEGPHESDHVLHVGVGEGKLVLHGQHERDLTPLTDRLFPLEDRVLQLGVGARGLPLGVGEIGNRQAWPGGRSCPCRRCRDRPCRPGDTSASGACRPELAGPRRRRRGRGGCRCRGGRSAGLAVRPAGRTRPAPAWRRDRQTAGGAVAGWAALGRDQLHGPFDGDSHCSWSPD